MLVLAGEVHHLRHFRFRHLIGVDAALADAVLMDVQHNAGRVVARLVEEALEHVHRQRNLACAAAPTKKKRPASRPGALRNKTRSLAYFAALAPFATRPSKGLKASLASFA